MIAKRDVEQVREDISTYVGSRVRLKANKGRRKYIEREGILQNTYPSIFVVKVDNDLYNHSRILSFSYTDLLTHSVELYPCE